MYKQVLLVAYVIRCKLQSRLSIALKHSCCVRIIRIIRSGKIANFNELFYNGYEHMLWNMFQQNEDMRRIESLQTEWWKIERASAVDVMTMTNGTGVDNRWLRNEIRAMNCCQHTTERWAAPSDQVDRRSAVSWSTSTACRPFVAVRFRPVSLAATSW